MAPIKIFNLRLHLAISSLNNYLKSRVHACLGYVMYLKNGSIIGLMMMMLWVETCRHIY